MKGLIYKDLMLLGRQAKLLLVIVAGLTCFWTWTGDTVTARFFLFGGHRLHAVHELLRL